MSEPIETPIVSESILESTKKMLGLTKDYVSFDADIVVNINTVLSNLTQMGIGPEEGFTITGYDETWDLFTTSNALKTQQIKTYIYLKVKSIFDPSANANITKALENSISELEYRLYLEEDNAKYKETLEVSEEVVVDE